MVNGTERQRQRVVYDNYRFKSGLRISEHENGFGIFPPLQSRSRMRFVGGIGVTDRDAVQMEMSCPGVNEHLYTEQGKIVVLGSGFSSLTTTAADRFMNGGLRERPVVVDLFDYAEAAEDLSELRDRCQNEGVPFNFPSVLLQASTNAEAIRVGLLESVTYLVGSGNPPEAIQDADLLVNIEGPSLQTLDEQLSLLAPTGVLLTTNNLLRRRLPRGFSAKYKQNHAGRLISHVRRTSLVQ